jgi:1-phosphatidylinositol-4-phosphate 5-kinase
MKLFEFYDFSPRVFHLIRNMYGIQSDAYLKSIGPENLLGGLFMGNIASLKEQCSTGKSGSFFYYTSDSLYMLKTISHMEFLHFKSILKDYYHHLRNFPHTLIARFYGLHKIKYVKARGTERIYFVVMSNVFKTTRDIQLRFDLKGSKVGRTTKKTPGEEIDSNVALKDLDFIEMGIKINLSPGVKKQLI